MESENELPPHREPDEEQDPMRGRPNEAEEPEAEARVDERRQKRRRDGHANQGIDAASGGNGDDRSKPARDRHEGAADERGRAASRVDLLRLKLVRPRRVLGDELGKGRVAAPRRVAELAPRPHPQLPRSVPHRGDQAS